MRAKSDCELTEIPLGQLAEPSRLYGLLPSGRASWLIAADWVDERAVDCRSQLLAATMRAGIAMPQECYLDGNGNGNGNGNGYGYGTIRARTRRRPT